MFVFLKQYWHALTLAKPVIKSSTGCQKDLCIARFAWVSLLAAIIHPAYIHTGMDPYFTCSPVNSAWSQCIDIQTKGGFSAEVTRWPGRLEGDSCKYMTVKSLSVSAWDLITCSTVRLDKTAATDQRMKLQSHQDELILITRCPVGKTVPGSLATDNNEIQASFSFFPKTSFVRLCIIKLNFPLTW